jgi:aspartate kinase
MKKGCGILKTVMKFGGTSVGNGARIRRVVNIIKDHVDRGTQVVVVVSAMNDVTDNILRVAEAAATGNHEVIGQVVAQLASRHTQAAKEVLLDREVLRITVGQIEGLLEEFRQVLTSVSTLTELTPRSKDYLLSFGEKLSTTLVHAGLLEAGIPARFFTGGEAGIVTNDDYGAAVPLLKVTAHRVRETLSPLLEDGITPVVTGYIASTQDDVTTTLGRGGSDYTATLLGYALDVGEVWIWTDVAGLMTADPKIEPSAKTIESISYSEAMELVYFGAKAMHPKALEPALEKEIPIRIKNTFNPTSPGTYIEKNRAVISKNVAKAVTVIWDAALITVGGAGMIGTPGVAAQVFGILGENHVNILMISQSSSEANISIIIRRGDLEKAVNLLELAFLGKGMIRDVSFDEDICVIAVVGAGMRGSVGVAARIFTAIASQGVNVKVIAQGSSELNVSFVVSERDGVNAVRALHHEFQLASQET